MDRGAWQATVHGVARVGHNLVTKPSIYIYLYHLFLSVSHNCLYMLCIIKHKHNDVLILLQLPCRKGGEQERKRSMKVVQAGRFTSLCSTKGIVGCGVITNWCLVMSMCKVFSCVVGKGCLL